MKQNSISLPGIGDASTNSWLMKSQPMISACQPRCVIFFCEIQEGKNNYEEAFVLTKPKKRGRFHPRFFLGDSALSSKPFNY